MALQALSYHLLNEVDRPSALHQVMSYHFAYHKNELQFLNYRELGRIFHHIHSLVLTEFVDHTNEVLCLAGNNVYILSSFLLLIFNPFMYIASAASGFVCCKSSSAKDHSRSSYKQEILGFAKPERCLCEEPTWMQRYFGENFSRTSSHSPTSGS